MLSEGGIVLDKVKIAVIDNGVVEKVLRHPLEYRVYIDDTNCCVIDNEHMDLLGFIHGTICAMIIVNNFSECMLSSVKILNDDGIGKVDKLKIALDWCYQNNIFLVNLSLGVTHFQDRTSIRDVINHYANRGMVIVAASANDGYKTYPASFSNVIGIAAGDVFKIDINLQKHIGVDFIVPSDHEIVLRGNPFKVGNSNSYAAPYVTAMIGKYFEKKSYSNVYTIRRELSSKEDFVYYPDWIEIAWVSKRCEQSREEYYFEEVSGELEGCLSVIDTIIVNNKEEFKKYCKLDKHMVYLGQEPIEYRTLDRYFWCRKQRVKQIVGSRKREAEIGIPVIICKFSENQDSIYWLSELRKYFAKDGYNMFTVSSKVESVLYDLEFLPEELCNKSNREDVYNFLYWQTYYCQSDALLMGIDDKKEYDINVLEKAVDMIIVVKTVAGMVKIDIYCDGNMEVRETINCLESRSIHLLYQKVLKLFMEVTDEQ